MAKIWASWLPQARGWSCPPWWPYGSELPAWDIWIGAGGQYCARLAGSEPAITVRGEDPADLRDQIRRRMLQALL